MLKAKVFYGSLFILQLRTSGPSQRGVKNSLYLIALVRVTPYKLSDEKTNCPGVDKTKGLCAEDLKLLISQKARLEKIS